MAWKQSKQWETPQPKWDYWHKRQPKKPQPHGKGKDGGLPGYDAASSWPSSSSKGQTQEETPGINKALKALFKANNLVVPQELKEVLKDDGLEEIQEEQRSLNQKRKAITKIERLKKAKGQKQQQWETFKANLTKHLQQEREKYDKDMNELAEAIAKAEKALEDLENGVTPEKEQEMDLSMLEEEDQMLKIQLEESKRANVQYQMRLEQLEKQLQQAQAYTANQETTTAPMPKENQYGPTSPQGIHKREEDQRARQERQARMRKVQQEMDKQEKERNRERSPRRESQESDA